MVRLSKTSAHAFFVMSPVTGPMPGGSACHVDKSAEYSEAAEAVFVGVAPPRDEGPRNRQKTANLWQTACEQIV